MAATTPAPVNLRPNRKLRPSSKVPPAQRPATTRKGKEKAEPLKPPPPVRNSSRNKDKATTSQSAVETGKSGKKDKGTAAEPNKPGAEEPDALSIIVEEETGSIVDREMAEVEDIATALDSLPSTMLRPTSRPLRARGEHNLASVPHSVIEALHMQLAKQNVAIADLKSEIRHLESKYAGASSATGKQPSSPAPNPASDASAKFQEIVESLSSRMKALESADPQNRVNELEAKMDAALRELKEQRNDLVLLDKAAEVLYAQNKQLESRPLAGRVVAFGAPSLPDQLKRKHGDNEETNAQQERPTKIFVTPGLAPGTRQWVEEGPNGLKIHTRTGLEPMAAAYRREMGR